MDNFETNEEQKDKIRKEILDDLNNNSNKNTVINNGQIQSFARPKKTSTVSFNKNNINVENSNSNNNTTNDSNNDNNQGSGFVVIFMLVVIVIVGFMLFPEIKKRISKPKKIDESKITVTEEKEEEVEKLKLTSESAVNAKYPVLHVDSSVKNTYLSLDKVTVDNLTNNEILYNGLVRVYEGNMPRYKGKYNGSYCGNNDQKVSVTERYVELRITGMFNKSVKFKHNNILVPVNNPASNYVGIWKYDSSTKTYVYYGNCDQKKNNISYYDINYPYDIDTTDKNIDMYLYNYIGFAIVDSSTNGYAIYSDANYTNKVDSGVLKTNNYKNELKTIVGNIGKDKLNKYKYSFTTKNCPYEDYCFVSGEWVK